MIEYILYAVGVLSLSAFLWFLFWRRAHTTPKPETVVHHA
jgi:hypothetical protein